MTISDCWFNGHMKLEIRGDNKVTLLHCCYRDSPLDTKTFEEFKKINIIDWCSSFLNTNLYSPWPCIELKNDVCDFSKGEKTLKCLDISLSHACNLRCPMCFMGLIHKDTPEIKQLYFETLYRVKDELPMIRLTDHGEPFFYKQKMMDFFKVCPQSLTIFAITNATLLTPEYLFELADLKCNIQLIISLDGITKPTYQKIRGVDKLDHVINIIKISKDLGLLSSINIVKQEDNSNEISMITDFAKSTNITYAINERNFYIRNYN